MQNKYGIHCFVAGKVQGVWFRASTQEQAQALGLTGWVRNLSDGRVEVMAFGGPDQLRQLAQWLKQGSPLARVDEVAEQEIAWQEYEHFVVK